MRKSPHRSFRGCLCPPFMCALQSAHIRPRSTRPNAIDAAQRQSWVEDSMGEWFLFVQGSIVQFHLFEYEMSRGLEFSVSERIWHHDRIVKTITFFV